MNRLNKLILTMTIINLIVGLINMILINKQIADLGFINQQLNEWEIIE